MTHMPLTETDAKGYLQHVWRTCVKPVHDGEFNVYSEALDKETYVYLDVKGLGLHEEFTLQIILGEGEGLKQEAGYIQHDGVLVSYPNLNMPYHTLLVNPWDFYSGADAVPHRKKYIAILAMMLVLGYENSTVVYFDDDFSYGYHLTRAIEMMARKFREED